MKNPVRAAVAAAAIAMLATPVWAGGENLGQVDGEAPFFASLQPGAFSDTWTFELGTAASVYVTLETSVYYGQTPQLPPLVIKDFTASYAGRTDTGEPQFGSLGSVDYSYWQMIDFGGPPGPVLAPGRYELVVGGTLEGDPWDYAGRIVVTAVPEPAAALALLVGLALLPWATRRRRAG
jgi:hypothetical protein